MTQPKRRKPREAICWMLWSPDFNQFYGKTYAYRSNCAADSSTYLPQVKLIATKVRIREVPEPAARKGRKR